MNFYKKTPFAMKRMFANLNAARKALPPKERKEFDKWFVLEQFKAAARTMSADELVELKAEIVRLTKEKEERAAATDRKPSIRKATIYRPNQDIGYGGYVREREVV